MRLPRFRRSRQKIARRFLTGVVLFSTAITLLTTGIQLFVDFRSDVAKIQASFDQVRSIGVESLTESVWVLDQQQIETLLQGLLRLRDIVHVGVSVDGKVKWEAGRQEASQLVSKEIPIIRSHRGKDLKIGILQATASLAPAYQRLLDKALLILVSNGVKTFLVALFVLALFRFLVTRHLETLSGYARSIAENLHLPPLSLNKTQPDVEDPDEIDQVTIALNDMRENLAVSNRELVEQSEKTRLLLDSTAEAIYGIDMEGNCTFCNTSFLTLTRHASTEDVLGKNIHSLIHHSNADGQPIPVAECRIFNAYQKGLHVHADDEVFWRADGSCFPVNYQSFPIQQNGIFVGAVVSFSDITERRQADARLHLAAEVFEHAAEAILITDRNVRIVDANPAFSEITGYALADVLGKNPSVMNSGRQTGEFYAKMWNELKANGQWRGEIWDRRKDGEVFPKNLSIRSVRNEQDEITNYVAVFSDITEIKGAQEKLLQLAHYDALTNLPNRTLLQERLETSLSQARRHNRCMGVMFIDLDRFKEVNDTLGHSVGDLLLKEVSERLLDCVRVEDTVARLSGDEFTIALSELSSSRDAEDVAHRIIESLTQPMHLGGLEVMVSASIGIALFPGDGDKADTLMRNADRAMYSAKSAGRDTYRFFDEEMNAGALERLSLEVDLRRALASNQFELYFQPRLDLSTARVISAEALIRWHHPERGMVLPGIFIPIAEDTGLIVDIGRYVLQQACAWARNNSDGPNVSVNLSTRQFRDPNLLADIQAMVEETKVPPHRLEFELTESLVMDDLDKSVAILEALKDMGHTLSVDDFGTGYSSLAYLKRLPVDTLKIDRAFIGDLQKNADDEAIVRAIISMAHTLNLSVVAEGVETLEQFHFLQAHNCNQVQGYFLSHPVPHTEFAAACARVESMAWRYRPDRADRVQAAR